MDEIELRDISKFKKVITLCPHQDSDDMEWRYKKQAIGYGFVGHDDGCVGLIRCPRCGRENYALAVIDGICVWCGFNAND